MAAVGFLWACLCLCGAHMCGENRLDKVRNLLFTCALPSRCECPDGNFEAQISDWGDVGDRKTAGKQHFSGGKSVPEGLCGATGTSNYSQVTKVTF